MMAFLCPAKRIQSCLAFESPNLLAASKDITTPCMLFYRISIIAEGNSMGELDITLKDKITDVFGDISPLFPVLHTHPPDAPAAAHIFHAVIMGVVLKLAKKKGGLATLTLLLESIHKSTLLLRTLLTEAQIPNYHCLNLYTNVIDLISSTIPTDDYPLGFGKTLNPSEFIHNDQVKEKLGSLEAVVQTISDSMVKT
ncbi:hypothetical protein DL96DRAFT_1776537 [Flagelloscypha sp. PMI_526]|nr:hypothetical protein DL96DRAFT_1776537 [Flagelloscypha sp. PMI_526]